MKREPLPKILPHDGMELFEAYRTEHAAVYQGVGAWRAYRINPDGVKETLGDLLCISPNVDIAIDVAAKIGPPS